MGQVLAPGPTSLPRSPASTPTEPPGPRDSGSSPNPACGAPGWLWGHWWLGPARRIHLLLPNKLRRCPRVHRSRLNRTLASAPEISRHLSARTPHLAYKILALVTLSHNHRKPDTRRAKEEHVGEKVGRHGEIGVWSSRGPPNFAGRLLHVAQDSTMVSLVAIIHWNHLNCSSELEHRRGTALRCGRGCPCGNHR